jgi:hypothetical protein
MKFTDLMKQLSIPYRELGHEHCRPGWIQIDCPSCGRSGHFRLGYNLRGRYCNCWACGPKRLSEVLVTLAGLSPLAARSLTEGLDNQRNLLLPAPGRLRLPSGLGDLLPAHETYLRERGFNPTRLVKLWRIRGLGQDGRSPSGQHLSWRIFIPITLFGEIVSWTTRHISNVHKIRYRAAGIEHERISRKKLLYGEDYVRHSTIVVCEGPTDVWRVGPGCVATLGTGVSTTQVVRLGRYSRRVVCFDAEKEGQMRAKELCDRLMVLDGVTENVVLDAKDPGSASDREIMQLRQYCNISF